MMQMNSIDLLHLETANKANLLRHSPACARFEGGRAGGTPSVRAYVSTTEKYGTGKETGRVAAKVFLFLCGFETNLVTSFVTIP